MSAANRAAARPEPPLAEQNAGSILDEGFEAVLADLVRGVGAGARRLQDAASERASVRGRPAKPRLHQGGVLFTHDHLAWEREPGRLGTAWQIFFRGPSPVSVFEKRSEARARTRALRS